MIADGRTSKTPGVVWHRSKLKWMAQIYIGKVGRVSQYQYLGYFDTKEEAIEAIRKEKDNG